MNPARPPAGGGPRNYAWALGGFLLIVVIAWLNRFPEGAIFSGGDVVQYFDRSFVERNFRHMWSHIVGQGFYSPSFLYYPFYAAVFFVSDLLRLGESREAMLYMVFLCGGSFLGWLLAHALLSGDRPGPWSLEATLFALVYAINPYTFHAFYFIWGFSPFLFLYPLFPVIAVATIEYFAEADARRARRLLAVLFFAHAAATIAFTNLPFLVGMNLILGFVVLLDACLRANLRVAPLLGRGIAYLGVQLAANSWAVLPQLPNFLFEANPLVADGTFSNWILWQRLPLWEVMSLNPVASRLLEVTPLAALSLALFAAALVSWILRQPKNGEARALAALCAVGLIVLIESKGLGILPGSAAVWAFSNPVMGALRSNGKVAIFLPFFLLFALVALRLERRGIRTAMLAVVSALLLVSAYPMVTGELQTRYSVGIAKDHDCATSRFCYLNRIPPEYREAAEAVARDGLGGKILSLPFTETNSPNWTEYPAWKHIGVEPTSQLFALPVVQINDHHHLFGNPVGRHWERGGTDDARPLLQLAGDLAASYVLFHRDVEQRFVYPAAAYLQRYEEAGYIERIFESGFLTVYRIHAAARRGLVTSGPDLAPNDVHALSPTRYVVTMRVNPALNEIVFRESFSTMWRVYGMPADSSGELPWWRSFGLSALPEAAHRRFAGYANRWQFEGEPFCRKHACVAGPDGQLVATLLIEYAPQKWVYLLQAVAIAFAFGAAVILFANRYSPRAHSRHP